MVTTQARDAKKRKAELAERQVDNICKAATAAHAENETDSDEEISWIVTHFRDTSYALDYSPEQESRYLKELIADGSLLEVQRRRACEDTEALAANKTQL